MPHKVVYTALDAFGDSDTHRVACKVHTSQRGQNLKASLAKATRVKIEYKYDTHSVCIRIARAYRENGFVSQWNGGARPVLFVRIQVRICIRLHSRLSRRYEPQSASVARLRVRTRYKKLMGVHGRIGTRPLNCTAGREVWAKGKG